MATIQKRGQSFLIRVSCGYRTDGTQIIQSLTWKPEPNMTPKQIEKELQRQAVLFEEACNSGQVVAAVKFETVAEEWLENYAKLNLRHTSYTRYLQLKPRIYPVLGHLRMNKISVRHIQKFITDLAVNGENMRTGEPLKRKSIQHHLIFISSVFKYAMRLEMVSDNPCERVILPKEEKAEKEIYTIEEVERIFEKLQDEDVKPLVRMFVYLAVYSGFRRGELLGLEWRDVDWEKNVVSVRRTSNYSIHKGTYTDTTKTKRSQRSSQLPQIVMDMLKAYKILQDKEKEQIGDKWEESGRIFTSWCGKPLCTTLPYKWFKQFCEKNGFRFCDLHSMRHFHASLLIFNGVDIVAVSNDLGHSAVATTGNIYCHLFQEAKAQTCSVIANALDFKKQKAV